MDKNRLVRFLCVTVVSVALMLALILTVTVCVGMADGGTPEETTYEGFRPSFPEGSFNWEDYFGSIEWPDSESRDPWETIEPPDETIPWDDLEWPTMPPSDDPPPEPEWPTLPEGWDTLPEEWGTLPPEWGENLPNVGDIDDVLAGMDGSLGLPAGAIGAGLASQLTVLNVFVEKDDTLYLKTKAFGDYDGRGWGEAQAYSKTYLSSYSVDYIPYLAASSVSTVPESLLLISPVMQVRVLPYYVTTYYSSTDHIQSSDVTVTSGSDEPYALYYCSLENPQALWGISSAVADYEKAYAKWAKNQYLTLDGETYDYMQRIIEREGFDRNDPEIIERVATYIQSAATYNLLYDRNLDKEDNVALAFLGGYKEGVCRHFATSATLLYRALGIPARYVVGFAADVTAGDVTAIKGADAHAWVEVYVEGFGWRYVEVTGAPAPEPLPPDTETDTAPTGIKVTLKPVDLAIRYKGETVIHSGELEGFADYEAKGYTYEAQVTGYLQGCGSCLVYLNEVRIFDPDRVDVTADFDITRGTGVLTAYMYEVTYASLSESKVYDGTALRTEGVTLVAGELPRGYSVELIPRGGQTAVGRGYAAFDLAFLYDDGSGNPVDRTHYFLVHKRYGTLTVTPATITVKAADAQKVYDGKPLVAKDMYIIDGELAEGDYIRSFTVEGSQTRIGRSDNIVADIVIRNAKGEDVTRNYNIITVAGTLKVTNS